MKKTIISLSLLLFILSFPSFIVQATSFGGEHDTYDSPLNQLDETEWDEWSDQDNSQYDSSYEMVTTEGKVLEILERNTDMDPFSGVEMEHHVVKLKITSGEYKGDVIVAESYNYPGDGRGYGNFQLKENDRVFVQIQFEDGLVIAADITDYKRDRSTILLVGIFIALLVIFGQKQGFKSILTLGFTLFIIFKFMVPYLFAGYHPVLLAIVTGAIVTAVTFVTVSGFSRKTLAALAGTVGGLASAAIISIIFSNAMKLTGFHGEEERMLQLFHNEVNIDFQGLLLAGIIIGALGAVMDVAISIASSMDEVKKADPTIKAKQLFQSGMNVGKDIMGTMANTLILAYVGAALPLLMLLYAYENTFSELIHMEFLVVEILRTVAGSIGLILSIPITAFVGAFFIKSTRKRRQQKEII
ncbi:hypothetical protein BKP35_01210 [Anaerobacillus arseniciselenatis]|uniref:YibE/F family protein n=1 Tax=Anaerobacillus arseniciselenatis TaxID=85682 RepID=A0A1S2LT06_9BACI|nr:YibE/F family protein [Anaerobacillus arseniciselenatis]OIJ15642.1 hypothetical protein BKP35_01210 [Anaerobacillus arseniciselenatis]